MKEQYLKATLRTVEVDGVYKFKTSATIDGANGLIHIDTHHVNKRNNIDEQRSVTITVEELRQLNNIISKEL